MRRMEVVDRPCYARLAWLEVCRIEGNPYQQKPLWDPIIHLKIIKLKARFRQPVLPSGGQVPEPSPSHGMRQPPSNLPTAPQSQDGTSGLTEEPSIYINAKQFKRILHRRAAREKLAQKLKRMDSRTRKPYMHESRHQHAATRPRGLGGRFLTREEMENLRTSSQERTDGFEARVSPNSPSEHRFAMKQLSKITKDMTILSMAQKNWKTCAKIFRRSALKSKLHTGEEERGV